MPQVIAFEEQQPSNPQSSQQSSLAQQLARIAAEKNVQQGLEKYQSLLNQGDLSDAERLEVMRSKALYTFQSDELQQAIVIYGQAKIIAEALNDQRQLAEIEKMLGVMRYFRGDNQQALSHYKQSLLYYVTQGEALQQAHLLNNIALANAAMGNYEVALNAYEQAEPLYSLYGSTGDQIDVRFNIAGLYVHLFRYDVAIESFLEVKKYREQTQDLDGLALVHSDLGIAYKYAGNFELAEKFQLLAFHYYQEQQLGYHLATQGVNLAGLYNQFEQFDKTRFYAELAVEYGTKHEHYGALAASYYELAVADYVSSAHDKACVNLDKAKALAIKVADQDLLDDISQLRALTHAATGKYILALQEQSAFTQEIDQRSNQEMNEKLAEFETQQLKQRISHLEAQEKLSQLEFDKANQARNFIVFILIFITVILLLLMQKKRSKQAKLELESMVNSRTEELLETTRKLEDANRIKNQFLANVTHEIRTPLSVVIGNTEALLNNEVQAQEQYRCYQHLHSNSLYLLEIVNDILDLSKIEANQIQLSPKPIELGTLFGELNAMFEEQARNKGLVFQVNLNLPEKKIINIDAMRFNQILINLCSNAVKFTSHGNVTVDVSLLDNQLIIKVSDTGIGMDSVQVEQVFGCFVQGDNSISRRFGGSGLGLYLVSNLCKLMGATIDVSSKPGQGSIFSVAIPVSSTKHDDPSQAMTASIHTQTAYQFSGRVLVAEDHPENRALIRLYLQRLGLTVETVADGQQALHWLQEHEVDVVLMDIQMPNLDGFSALTRLIKSGFDKPVFAFTANAMAHEIEHYLNVGFTGYIEKPLNRENIVETLKQHLPFEAEHVAPTVPKETVNQDDQVEILATSFIVSAKGDLSAICRADEAQDWLYMSELCHKLSGAAQMFNFSKLADISRQLELCLLNRRFDQKRALLLALKMEVVKLNETSSAES
ncbi:response regulator [Thalassotalea litorea]|uniref:response regulator n=1 Tax=Thalassotalea litorea TaxID=2020715 RepID=UPI0014853D69|nr:response regulator [Thalassotalea litorea]